MNDIERIKGLVDLHENEARQFCIKAINYYISKFEYRVIAIDKIGGYHAIFDQLKNQKLGMLKSTLAKIIESKVLEGEEIL